MAEAQKVVQMGKLARFNHQRLSMGEAVPSSGQRYTYSSADPMRSMLTPEFFLPIQPQLRPGDCIRIHQMDNNNFGQEANELLAYVDVLVITSKKGLIRFHQESDIFYIPDESGELSPEANPATAAKYGRGKVKWCVGERAYRIVDINDESVILASGIEEKEIAVKMAAGEIPIPD